MKFKFLLFIIITFSSPLFANEIKQEKPKEIIMGFLQPKGHPVMEWLTLLYSDAFNQMGIKMKSVYYPAKRLSVMSNLGIVDGELGRSYVKGNIPKNLVRVPIAHWEAEFGAYIKDKNIKIESWDSFKNSDLRIECLYGVKLCETTLLKYVSKEQVSIVPEAKLGIRKLANNKSDVFIFTKLGVKKCLQSEEFKNSGIVYTKTLHKEEAFAYLHKKWDFLIPQLSLILKKMKKEGLFLKYKKQGEKIAVSYNKKGN